MKTIAVPLRVRLGQYVSVLLQLALVVAANRAAFALRFDGHEPAWALAAWSSMLPWLLVVRGGTLAALRVSQGMWRYTSMYDLKMIVTAVVLSSGVFAAIASSPLGPAVYPGSIFVIDAVLLTLALGGVRIIRPLSTEFSIRGRGKRLLIIGAGDAGEMVVRDIRAHGGNAYDPIGFIDDDPAKVGRRIHGVPVLGTREHITRIVRTFRPEEALIAIPSADAALVRSVVRTLEPYAIPLKTVPRLRDIVSGKVRQEHIRTLQFEDLLARAPVGLDSARVHALIGGRRVLVTGAGGSIGGEICRQIATMRPASLIMVDQSENGLHALHLELKDRRDAPALHQLIGDITDAARVDAIFALHRPDIVFHAAAHKHVPMMEANPCEAIKNNVTGTRILADAADRHHVDRFILISTDKAVNPVSAMGASKHLAELVVRSHGEETATTFAAVRFGNVLGTNGSVVPRFIEQIRRGGPVTVTDPEMRRFFMLVSEAVHLVLHAAAQAESGAVYVLEMGEQVRVLDMARHLIRLEGLVPDKDIAIEFVGLRPGEKLSEDLVADGETVQPSRTERIMRVRDRRGPSAETLMRIRGIEDRAASNDVAAVMTLLGEMLSGRKDEGVSAPAPARPPAEISVPPLYTTAPMPDLSSLDQAVDLIPFAPARLFSPRDLS
jgi:FlaA1/EpsC-like NDP-sugar epimerase